MKILEVSVAKILEVSALLTLFSCALAERAVDRIGDGDRALTVVTAQRAVQPMTKPLVERLDNLNFKMDLVGNAILRIENNQAGRNREIAFIKKSMAEVQKELKRLGKVNKKVLRLERKILKITNRLARLSNDKK